MCGIAGFLAVENTEEKAHLLAKAKKMADAIAHRGPDDSGAWADPDAGIALGHRRLSIIDLSPHGHQPMQSACGRWIIVYNGEIYNFQELRAELEQSSNNYSWRGHSDTEVALAAISEWGVEKALTRFNGMFAFALWDRQQRTLYLARDRLGEKPLYYGWIGKTFLFGSELKALRAYPDWHANIDRNALTLLMRHNYIAAPYSIYQGVAKLPPGTLLTLTSQDAQARKNPGVHEYWSAKTAAEQGLAAPLSSSMTEAQEELDALLRQAVKLRMVADVPLGAFLSGGIDSSTIVALMQAQSTRAVKTFSIGFHEDGYNEAEHAMAVARHLGTEHTELYVTSEEAQAVIPKLPTLYDEPFSDSSQIPTFLVSQLTRQHVTVALSGDGGDELFAGYKRYLWGKNLWRNIAWMPVSLRNRLVAALTLLSPEQWQKLSSPVHPLLPANARSFHLGDKLYKLSEVLAIESAESMYQRLISHWKKPSELVINGQEPATALTDSKRWAQLPKLMQRMMYLDQISYLPDDILVKVDRASMGVSLESRIPLLDHNIVEFAWRVPLSMKFHNGRSKWLLRQVLYKYVPKELVERPKMGFGIPLDVWLRHGLRDWAESLLDQDRLKREGFFQADIIRQAWREHLAGERNWQAYLWNVLMFQTWLEHEQRYSH